MGKSQSNSQVETDNFLTEAGLTLLEILIVLTLVGGLAAWIASKVNTNLKKAKYKQSKLIISSVVTAVNQFSADCGKLPASLDALITNDNSCKNWGPSAYLKKNEINDGFGKPLTYSAEGDTFEIKSLGEDGKEGGTEFGQDQSSND